MPTDLFVLSFFVGLFIQEILYFKVAFRYKIIDKPNQRSSHKKLTIRGGGIIFPTAVLLWCLSSGLQYPLFIMGLCVIATISFIDDIKHLHSKIRFLFHAIAIAFILFGLEAQIEWYWCLVVLILGIGTINAWNFMDGINGITGSYSLVIMGTLYYINHSLYPFINERLLLAIILSLVVFNFFNFRRKAVCFAGDVGSVSIAFIVCFLLIRLVAATENFLLLGLILLYGLDTATTIIFRLFRRENIFKAHRSHFYQFLVNEQGWPHLVVSAFYAVLQLIINMVLVTQFSIRSSFSTSAAEFILLLIASVVSFLLVRFSLEGHKQLMRRKPNNAGLESEGDV